MTIQRGITRTIAYKKETIYGTAPAASSAQAMRRVNFVMNKTRPAYASNELRTSMQRSDVRLGDVQLAAQLQAELSPKTFGDLFASLLRGSWTAGATTGAQTNITAQVADPQVTRGAGSYITDGFKVGDVIRMTGWATTGAPNNAFNYRIVAMTATTLTLRNLTGKNAVTFAAKVAGDSVTTTVVNKKLLTPQSAQTAESYAWEIWNPDIPTSELGLGLRLAGAQLQMNATGLVTVTFSLVGQDVTTSATQYFTSPTAQTTNIALSSAVGAARLIYSDASFANDKATITGFNITISGDAQPENTAFSLITPDVFSGVLSAQGQMSVLFEDTYARDAFFKEVEAGLYISLVSDMTATSDFIGIYLPRIKLTDASKDDTARAITETIPFVVLENMNGGTGTTSDRATVILQDSAV